MRKVADFVSSDDDILVVNGYAGTGKTTAMASVITTLKEFQTKCVLLAPTGRAAKVLASYFVREKCKKVVFYSLDEFFIPAFRKELEENGIAIDNTCIFNNVQKLKKALPSLIENGMDGIFIQRDDLHMKEILHCISAEKDRYKVKILLSPGLATQRDKSEFPHLNIALPDMDYYRHQCVALGSEVANGIADILDSGTIPPGVTLNGYALPENNRKKKK
jgi:hypothetical protein